MCLCTVIKGLRTTSVTYRNSLASHALPLFWGGRTSPSVSISRHPFVTCRCNSQNFTPLLTLMICHRPISLLTFMIHHCLHRDCTLLAWTARCKKPCSNSCAACPHWSSCTFVNVPRSPSFRTSVESQPLLLCPLRGPACLLASPSLPWQPSQTYANCAAAMSTSQSSFLLYYQA